MRELFKCFSVLLLIFIVLFVLLYIGFTKRCSAKATRMGFDSEYLFFGGCLVEYEEGKWVPMKNYRLSKGVKDE